MIELGDTYNHNHLSMVQYMVGMRWAFIKYMVRLALDWSRGVVSRSLGGAEKSNSARMTFPCLEQDEHFG